MSDHSFTTTFSVEQTPKAAFDAITNARGWWSEEIGGTAALGDEFTCRYQDVHRCTIRVTEVTPYRKVSWRRLITTGEGQPDDRGRPHLAAEAAAFGQLR